jgi:hypothetical protein
LLCKASCFFGLVATAVISQPLNRFSTACNIKAPTNPASMPLVVATQLMITLSQHSSANANLPRSPLSQDSSSPSEYQLVSHLLPQLCFMHPGDKRLLTLSEQQPFNFADHRKHPLLVNLSASNLKHGPDRSVATGSSVFDNASSGILQISVISSQR